MPSRREGRPPAWESEETCLAKEVQGNGSHTCMKAQSHWHGGAEEWVRHVNERASVVDEVEGGIGNGSKDR